MTRLYTVMAKMSEVAAHFGAENRAIDYRAADIVEGLPGLAIIERAGERRLGQMRWGFPRMDAEMRERGEPPGIIGLVADLTNPLWQDVVQDMRHRCLIPLTHFANPAGDAGAKTRTWFSVKDQPIAAWAGFWANDKEAGPVFAGMTMEANAAIPPTNDRMPVLLESNEWGAWLHGGIRDVIGFQFRPPIAAARMSVIHTNDAWRSGKLPPPAEQLSLL